MPPAKANPKSSIEDVVKNLQIKQEANVTIAHGSDDSARVVNEVAEVIDILSDEDDGDSDCCITDYTPCTVRRRKSSDKQRGVKEEEETEREASDVKREAGDNNNGDANDKEGARAAQERECARATPAYRREESNTPPPVPRYQSIPTRELSQLDQASENLLNAAKAKLVPDNVNTSIASVTAHSRSQETNLCDNNNDKSTSSGDNDMLISNVISLSGTQTATVYQLPPINTGGLSDMETRDFYGQDSSMNELPDISIPPTTSTPATNSTLQSTTSTPFSSYSPTTGTPITNSVTLPNPYSSSAELQYSSNQAPSRPAPFSAQISTSLPGTSQGGTSPSVNLGSVIEAAISRSMSNGSPALSGVRVPQNGAGTSKGREPHVLKSLLSLGPSYSCTLCTATYTTQGLLDQHTQTEHERPRRCSTAPPEYKCDICNLAFNSEDEILAHLQTREHNINFFNNRPVAAQPPRTSATFSNQPHPPQPAPPAQPSPMLHLSRTSPSNNSHVSSNQPVMLHPPGTRTVSNTGHIFNNQSYTQQPIPPAQLSPNMLPDLTMTSSVRAGPSTRPGPSTRAGPSMLPSVTSITSVNGRGILMPSTSQGRLNTNTLASPNIVSAPPSRKKRNRKKYVFGKQYHCDICQRKYQKYKCYIQHYQRHMKKDEDNRKLYKCRHCKPPKFFQMAGNLYVHMKKFHDRSYKNYVCSFDDCTEAFGTKNELKTHRKIHEGGQGYTCQDCGKEFRCLSSFSTHKLSHSIGAPSYEQRQERYDYIYGRNQPIIRNDIINLDDDNDDDDGDDNRPAETADSLGFVPDLSSEGAALPDDDRDDDLCSVVVNPTAPPVVGDAAVVVASTAPTEAAKAPTVAAKTRTVAAKATRASTVAAKVPAVATAARSSSQQQNFPKSSANPACTSMSSQEHKLPKSSRNPASNEAWDCTLQTNQTKVGIRLKRSNAVSDTSKPPRKIDTHKPTKNPREVWKSECPFCDFAISSRVEGSTHYIRGCIVRDTIPKAPFRDNTSNSHLIDQSEMDVTGVSIWKCPFCEVAFKRKEVYSIHLLQGCSVEMKIPKEPFLESFDAKERAIPSSSVNKVSHVKEPSTPKIAASSTSKAASVNNEPSKTPKIIKENRDTETKSKKRVISSNTKEAKMPQAQGPQVEKIVGYQEIVDISADDDPPQKDKEEDRTPASGKKSLKRVSTTSSAAALPTIKKCKPSKHKNKGAVSSSALDNAPPETIKNAFNIKPNTRSPSLASSNNRTTKERVANVAQGQNTSISKQTTNRNARRNAKSCGECGQKFYTHFSYNEHFRTEHLSCKCGFVAPSIEELGNHKWTENHE